MPAKVRKESNIEEGENQKRRKEKRKKEGEKPHRPLQPTTLAVFPPWGNSLGASHMALTGCKINLISGKNKDLSGLICQVKN